MGGTFVTPGWEFSNRTDIFASWNADRWQNEFSGRPRMATLGLIEYDAASPEVRAVYDDIMATRKTDWINNFWKAIAHDPATLRRTWLSVKEVMAPGALDARTKEMLYLAVSSSNQCGYCIASHTAAARKAGLADTTSSQLMAVVGMANETNRLASGYQVEVDEQFRTGVPARKEP